MSEPVPAAATPPPRRRSVFLIVSLCLNVALIGLIVAGIVNAQRRMPWPPGGPLVPQALMKVASAEEQDRIQAITEAHAVRLGVLRRAANQARREVLRVFAAPRFDEGEFSSALEKMRVADTELETEITKMIAESAAQLSPGEREQVAEKIRQQTHPWWRRPMRRMTP